MIQLTIVNGDQSIALAMAKVLRGQSAYELAVEEGFVGTEAEWIASLYAIQGQAAAIAGAAAGYGAAQAALTGVTPVAAVAVTTFDASTLPDGSVLSFKGRTTANDGGGGTFTYDKTGTQTVDGVLVFAPAVGTGRLLRQGWTVLGFNGDINLDWSGAKGDYIANDSAAIQAAVRVSYGRTLIVPASRTYGMLDQVLLEQGITIKGTRGSSVFKALPGKDLTVNLFATVTVNAPSRLVQHGMLVDVVFDGANLTPQRWLQDAFGSTIVDPWADYYNAQTNPTGKIGNPAFPAWTIADTVAAGRRNPNYTRVASLLDLALADDFDVHGCIFRNHYGRAIFERGGRDVRIWDNDFDTVGKKDGAYHAVYTQSYGTPGSGVGFYSPSENIQVYGNRARNLERSFCAFMPTLGGVCAGNYVDGWQESCVFIGPAINYDGGFSWVTRNTLKNGIVSDIVCWGIEAGSAKNLMVRGNWIENAQQGAAAFPGAVNVTYRDNTAKNCGSAFSYPYGPFSERYAFNIGTPPIAGQAVATASLHLYEIGTQNGIGCDNLVFKDNPVIETRAAGQHAGFVYAQTKTGANSIAGTCIIEGGTLPTGMTLLDTSVGTVWQPNIPLSIRGVVGHASEAPVIATRILLAGIVGIFTLDVGFRPREVRVYAIPATGTLGQIALGTFTWNAAAARNDFSFGMAAVDGVGQFSQLRATDVIRLSDATGADQFLIEFTAWTETGFTLNRISAAEQINLRFVCIP